jgi:hypothetical protein
MSYMYLEQRNVDHSNNLQQAIKCPTILVYKSRIVGAALWELLYFTQILPQQNIKRHNNLNLHTSEHIIMF